MREHLDKSFTTADKLMKMKNEESERLQHLMMVDGLSDELIAVLQEMEVSASNFAVTLNGLKELLSERRDVFGVLGLEVSDDVQEA